MAILAGGRTGAPSASGVSNPMIDTARQNRVVWPIDPDDATLRFYERRRREQEEEMAALAGEKRDIGFGNQIRSYTLHPQQRVKDHRTSEESGNVEAVLEGDLDRFIRATLVHRAAEQAEKA